MSLIAFSLILSALPAAAAEFLWLSDIHFDPLADHALVDKLAGAEPAQWAEILATGSTKFSAYGRDTNWPLLSSVLQASTKQQPNAAFTLVTGDLLVHHFREQFDAIATVHDDPAFRSFVRKSVAFVGLQLKQRSPKTSVFIAVGNNDDDCGDYAIQPDGPFLSDTAKTIGDAAGMSNTDSYVHLGSYSIPNPALKHQRIIVLNSVFFSPRYVNRCAGQATADPGEQLLAWLASELETAKSHGEKVWLVYHIPPGVDAFATAHAKVAGTVTLLWKEVYLNKFQELLARYDAIVGANFAGHIHVDDFRLLGGSRKTSPFVIIGPAVSPITGQNPTFRTVDFDAHGKLKDEVTYHLTNLSEASPVWQLEYDFTKEWHLKNLNAQSYSKLFNEIDTLPKTTERWSTLYSTSHPASALAPAIFPEYFCASGHITAQAYRSCVNAKENEHGKTPN